MSYDITDAVGHLADPIADTPERTELRAVVAKLIANEAPNARTSELDENEEFDLELHKRLGELGLLALGGDPAYGGYGDGRDQLVIIEELASGPTSMAVFAIRNPTSGARYVGFGLYVRHGIERRVVDQLHAKVDQDEVVHRKPREIPEHGHRVLRRFAGQQHDVPLLQPRKARRHE